MQIYISKELLLTIFVGISAYALVCHGASVTAGRPAKSDQHAALNCTNHMDTIDRCSTLAAYSHSWNIAAYPLTSAQMKDSCDRITNGLKCARLHGKCLKGFARRSLTTFMNSRSKHSRRLCANVNDVKTVDFVKSNVCIDKANKKSLMIASEKELIRSLQVVTDNKTISWDDRLHSACCAASTYKSTVLRNIEPECVKFKDAQEDLMNSQIGELLEQACPESTRLAQICAKLPKLNPNKELKPGSLTRAALDLVEVLAETSKDGD